MPHAIRRGRPAMGTWFEAVLVGDDEGHLDAVAGAVLDEVERVERLLSRFDPRSEVARINRLAPRREVVVDLEVFQILESCRAYWEETRGYFDVTATSGGGCSAGLVLDWHRRSVRFARPGLAIDLGGFAKGYALERGLEIAEGFGVESALLHGGTSSVVTLGTDDRGEPWRVGVRNPFDDGPEALFSLELGGEALSCSASHGRGRAVSDLIDPYSGAPVFFPSACVVVGPRAAEAEALSTAFVCMGKCSAQYGVLPRFSRYRVAWIDRHTGRTTWEWFGEST